MLVGFFQRRWCLACIGLLATASQVGAQPTTRPARDLGLMFNVDGDNAFPAATLAESTRALQAEVASYAAVGVKTLCYSTAAGSDIMLYPTKVADTWGYRHTSYDNDPAWKDRIARMRSNMAEGGDALRTAGAQAKSLGMYFIPSQRMNDAHYAFGKPVEDYPLTGSFWLAQRDLVIHRSPVQSKPEYGELLDFSHDAVRAYRLSQIVEVIDRYQDLIDGFELDFTRFQIFFPDGKAAENAHVMTGFVEQVRAKLDDESKRRGHVLSLIVRVPPSLANCRWSGLDVEDWMRRGLVDVVVPSQMMTMGFEQPIDEFKRVGGPVQVYSGLLPRVTWSFPFSAPGTAALPPDRALSIEQLRGAAANAYAMGADGVYLFNFGTYAAWGKPDNAKAVDLSVRPFVIAGDVVFSISKAYWADNEDGYEYRKQLPTPLKTGERQAFTLMVGQAPGANVASYLRIGLRKPPTNGSIQVRLNGQSLLDGPLETRLKSSFDATDAKVAKQVQSIADLPTHFVVLKIDADHPATRGRNVIEIRIDADKVDPASSITDIDLGQFKE